MNSIRVTGLSSFYTCPYKFKNEPYEPNPKNTYHGDIVNMSVSSKGSLKSFLDYWNNTLEPSISLRYNLEAIIPKMKTIIDGLYEKYSNVYQEAKMYHKYDIDNWIEGTPDVIFFNEGERINIIDFKCSTHSRYSGNEMWDLNMQTYVYPLFVMDYFGTDEVEFSYCIADKNTSKIKKESKIRTREECQSKIKEVMEAYITAGIIEEYPAKENKLCMFCSLKKKGCPRFATNKVIEIEQPLF